MPTRKELLDKLQNEMERLTDAERDSTYALERYGDSHERASENLERAAQINADGFIKASENIQSAASTIVGGIFLGLLGIAFYKGIEALVERTKEFNKKTEMIKSIINLQNNNPYLTYRFVIDRSYATDTNREERQTMLNGLIADGFITQFKHNGNINALRIDKHNPVVKAYWDKIDDIRKSTQEYFDKHSSNHDLKDNEVEY